MNETSNTPAMPDNPGRNFMADGVDKPLRVLVIEDNEIDAMFVRRLLESNLQIRFQMEHAECLADALVRLQTTDYDVALIDLNLPDADGLESFDQVRALDARLPVVVFTGSDDEELGLRAIENGAQDFMAKNHVTGQMLFRSLRFAIARQRKVMGIQAAADTDPLTGMPNRRSLQARFTEMLAEAERDGQPMSLALLDIDHFKNVNDHHGHFVGDAVLKAVADLITDSLGDQMAAARFGGEEFALLLPGFELHQACDAINAILKRLANTTLGFEGRSIAVTASAGVVEVGFGEEWKDAYVLADVALYEAKSSGRNRLCQRESQSQATK